MQIVIDQIYKTFIYDSENISLQTVLVAPSSYKNSSYI